MRVPDLLGAVGNTPLVELPAFEEWGGGRLFAKLEGQNPSGSVKDRMAHCLVEDAERSAGLDRSRVLLESTSGNTGIALAMVAALRGYTLEIVMAENASTERKQLLRAFGARLSLSPASGGSDGALDQAREMAASDSRYVLTSQYENPANVRGMEASLGPELLREIPEMDTLVAAIGTGGTITGIARYFRRIGRPLHVVGVEKVAHHMIPGLRNLDVDFNPPILDLSLIDERIEVSADDAAWRTRQLTERAGIFAGPSSGAALHAAIRVAAERPRSNVVCIFPDGGWKYLSSVWTSVVPERAERLERVLVGAAA